MEAWGARDIATSGESWGKNSTNRVLNGLRFSCVYLCACVLAIPKCCFPLFMGFSWVVQCWFLNTLLCVLSSFSKKKHTERGILLINAFWHVSHLIWFNRSLCMFRSLIHSSCQPSISISSQFSQLEMIASADQNVFIICEGFLMFVGAAAYFGIVGTYHSSQALQVKVVLRFVCLNTHSTEDKE